MSTPSAHIAYPPRAHTTNKDVEVVSKQPQPVTVMSASRPPKAAQSEASRLRGGCIPCPVSFLCAVPPASNAQAGWGLLLHCPAAMLLLLIAMNMTVVTVRARRRRSGVPSSIRNSDTIARWMMSDGHPLPSRRGRFHFRTVPCSCTNTCRVQ